jgi:predicted GNAT superfamily acetyltransferase
MNTALAFLIRDALTGDLPAVLQLNVTFEHHLSRVDAARLAQLHAQASYHRVVEYQGEVVAFLMAHLKGTAYDSDNYAWFSHRYEQFAYIDRVVVAQSMQGKGVGQRLYDDVFAWAQAQGAPCVVCEFDIEPPNVDSERFHAKRGFTSVGRHTSSNTGKTVNMQLIAVP